MDCFTKLFTTTNAETHAIRMLHGTQTHGFLLIHVTSIVPKPQLILTLLNIQKMILLYFRGFFILLYGEEIKEIDQISTPQIGALGKGYSNAKFV